MVANHGQGNKMPKPPWLLGTEVSRSWSRKMQLISGLLLEISPWCRDYMGWVQWQPSPPVQLKKASRDSRHSVFLTHDHPFLLELLVSDWRNVHVQQQYKFSHGLLTSNMEDQEVILRDPGGDQSFLHEFDAFSSFSGKTSLVASFTWYTDGALPSGWKIQRTLQKCGTMFSCSEQSKGNFKPEHRSPLT
jgi:hypothetical protein